MASLFTKKTYKKALCGLLSLALLGAGTSAVAFSFSWFSTRNITDSSLTGSTAGAWFARGDGSSDEPYELTTSRHVYNLAWLQYMGVFNNQLDGTSPKTYYFVVDNDIDMDGLVIPPIGTEEYPFVGNFDGNQKIISNLIISNSTERFSSIPNKVSTAGYTQAAIIGFFGVIGQYNGSPENAYYNSSTNSVKDLYLDRITISNTLPNSSTSTAKTNILAGFLAGYVNGNITRCGVYRSKFDFAKGTTNITTSTSFTNVSDYSLIGSYDSNDYSWTDGPGGGGQDNDWGGSIDFKSINRRLNYITSNQNASTGVTSNSNFTNSTYDVTMSVNTKEPYWNKSSTDAVVYYIKDGSYIPLNIDELDAEMVDENGSVTEILDSNSWHTTNLYKNSKSETILKTNSAYLVGGSGNITSRAEPLDAGSYGGVFHSFGESSKSSSNSTSFEKKSFFELMTYKSGKHYVITNSHNTTSSSVLTSDYTRRTASQLGFKYYDSTLNNFYKTMNGAYRFHGFHMIQSNISSSYKTSHAATIFGETIENYEFIKSGLNFSIKDEGYLTAILGTYYSLYSGTSSGISADYNTLFNLYKVNRNSNYAITSIQKINKIYKDSSEKASFLYSDGTYSGSSSGLTEIIDFTKLSVANSNYATGSLVGNAAYFFEMPLSAGDYVICADSTNYKMAYLMYLDIGANASGSGGTKPALISKIDFIYEDLTGTLLKITDDNYENIKSGIAFAWTGVSTGELIYCKRFYSVTEGGTSSTIDTKVHYWDTDSDNGLAVTLVPTTGTNYSNSNDCIWT